MIRNDVDQNTQKKRDVSFCRIDVADRRSVRSGLRLFILVFFHAGNAACQSGQNFGKRRFLQFDRRRFFGLLSFLARRKAAAYVGFFGIFILLAFLYLAMSGSLGAMSETAAAALERYDVFLLGREIAEGKNMTRTTAVNLAQACEKMEIPEAMAAYQGKNFEISGTLLENPKSERNVYEIAILGTPGLELNISLANPEQFDQIKSLLPGDQVAVRAVLTNIDENRINLRLGSLLRVEHYSR